MKTFFSLLILLSPFIAFSQEAEFDNPKAGDVSNFIEIRISKNLNERFILNYVGVGEQITPVKLKNANGKNVIFFNMVSLFNFIDQKGYELFVEIPKSHILDYEASYIFRKRN